MMWTGHDVFLQGARLLDTVSFLLGHSYHGKIRSKLLFQGRLSYHGKIRSKLLFQDRLQKLSTSL